MRNTINKQKTLKDFGFESSFQPVETIGENPVKDMSNNSIIQLGLEILVLGAGGALLLFTSIVALIK